MGGVKRGVLSSWGEPPLGGETTREVVQRVSFWLQEIRMRYAGESLLERSHTASLCMKHEGRGYASIKAYSK
jgi:broad specificity phosphatase PhoE